jgi:CHAT domain-containing protein/Flp pilus assembly protein TadD
MIRNRLLFITILLAFGAEPASDSRRLEVLDAGARLLDQGRNHQAINLLVSHLEDHPTLIEAADLVIEAAQRECRLDSVLARLEGGGFASGGAPQTAFLRAHVLRKDRDFAAAARTFAGAADASLSVGDSVSAVFCQRRSVRCLLSAREAEPALAALDGLESLLNASRGPDRLELESVLMRGEAFYLKDELGEADSLMQGALVAARDKGYRCVTARALHALGQVALKRQYFAEAADYYREALSETRTLGATVRAAKLLNDLGQAETRLGNLDVAEQCLDESMELARSCRADWVLGYVYYGLGALAEVKGDTESAKNLFHQSIEQHAKQGNKWSELGARLRLAYRHINDGEYAPAIEQYNRCLDVYEASGSLYGKGWALSGLALASHRLGDFVGAEDYYNRALEARSRLGDRRGAAWCLNSLGMVNDMQANYRQALAYEHQALEIYEELEDRRGIGSVHFSMGSVYFYLGNFSKSMEHYERAYAIATEEGDTGLLERVASGMGSVYHDADRMDLAEKFYLQQLEMTRDTGETASVVWSLNNIASFYIESGDESKAGVYMEEAVSLLPEAGMDHIRSRTLFLRGKTMDSNAEAIDYTLRALELAEANGLKELQWKYLSDLGEYYQLEGDVAEAKRLQESSILEIEALRRGVGSDELRRHMLRPAITPYDRMVSLTIKSAPDEDAALEAFGYAERSKAQIFSALLREALSKAESEDVAGLNQKRDLVSRLSYVQSRLQDGSLDEGEKGSLLAQMERIERDLLQQEIRLASLQKDYGAAVYPVQNDMATLIGTLGPSERMLSYFLGQERSWLFTAKGGDLEVFELPDRATIEQKAGFYFRMLRQQAGDARTASLPAEVIEQASSELHTLLIGPVAERLEPGEILVIVPDGALNRLPFALLRDGETSLVQKHELFYAPSLQSLHYLRERDRSAGGDGHELTMFAVGSSGIPAGNGDMRRVYPYTDIAVEPLPLADEEARSVAAAFSSSSYLVGDDAGELSLAGADLARAEILHIAAHSYVDNEDVRRSFIVLSPPPVGDSGNSEDGLLQWHEITALELNASLVTLSACRAAGGVLAYGEGMTGLTQAFLYAGGNCVLASFIDVPDRFAGRFMAAFYRQLKEGLSGTAALRAAQVEAMGWTDVAHGPALWGSFALIGDGAFVVTGR